MFSDCLKTYPFSSEVEFSWNLKPETSPSFPDCSSFSVSKNKVFALTTVNTKEIF